MALVDLNEEKKTLDLNLLDFKDIDFHTNFHLNFIKSIIDRYGYIKAKIDHLYLSLSLAFKMADPTGIPKIEIDNIYFELDNP